MKIFFESTNDLPKLAWHASVDLANGVCLVRHGRWVEIFNEGFIEGVWDAPFCDFSFDSSTCVFGSGAIVRDNCIVFVSSTSTTDCLYYCSDLERVDISNSLPFLLASTDDELDPFYTKYPLINDSVQQGIRNYSKCIPTQKKTVNRLIHHNLHVGNNSFNEIEKNSEPAFDNFAEYFEYLTSQYQRIASNARDTKRKMPMAILSTQSKGYDSTAVNSIAKTYGIDKVFSVTRGKSSGFFWGVNRSEEPDDDGSEICNFFGLTCVPLDRHDISGIEKNEYLVYSTTHESGDLNLLAVSSFVDQPSVLLTGCLGEIWYTEKYYEKSNWKINSDLVRGDLGNHGMTEMRLNAGYVQLAMPFIGARSRQDIFNITVSQEMESWRLHTFYDRPIPRRIAEEAGLPRNMFGQIKMASVVEQPMPNIPFGDALRQDFFDYLIGKGILNDFKLSLLPLVRKWNGIVVMTSPRRHRWNYYLQRLISKIRQKEFRFVPLWPELNGQIFIYCCSRRAEEYRDAISPLGKR